MGNIIKKMQEKRIDRLYDKKKEATMSGNVKKKERLDKKITNLRGRSLSKDDMVQDFGYKKGGAKKSSYKKGGTVKRKK